MPPTHSLNEDFPNAHAATDLPQALFHRLRYSYHERYDIEWSDKETHLARAQNGNAADLSLKANAFVLRPLHAVSTVSLESPFRGRVQWAFRQPGAQRADGSGPLRRADE